MTAPDALRRFRAPLFLALFLFTLLAGGCGGAFAHAMKRGDQYSRAEMWDSAAEAYEEATRLDPSDPRAAVMLRHARHKQAAHRMAQARVMASRQDFVQALRLAREAVAFAPDHLPHQQELNAIVEMAVQHASSAAAQGNPQRALELASLVLDVAPHHAAAQAIASQVRQTLAQQRFDRAQAFFQQGLAGNAIVELAACLDFVPSFRDARERLTEAVTAVRREVTLRVALLPSEQPQQPRFSDVVSANRLKAALDPAIAFELSEQPDPASSLLVSGSELQISFHRDRRTDQLSCDYICGVDHHPNPDHDHAERLLADAERQVAALERDGSRIESDVHRVQRDVDEAELRVTREESELDRARRDLEVCRQKYEHGKGHCSSERSKLESHRRRLEGARRTLESERRHLMQARGEWTSVRDRIHSAEQDRSRALDRMRSTPRTVAVDRTCSHGYSSEQHTLAGRLSVKLSVQEPSGRIVVQEPHLLEAARSWQTHAAQPGRCPSAAKGPPSPLPSDQDLRQELESKLVAQVGKHITDYARERHAVIRAEALRAEAEGRIDHAMEGWVRLTIAGPMDRDARSHFDDLLRRTRGIDGIRWVEPAVSPFGK